MLPQEKIDLGVAPEMVRVSVGIEHIRDIIYDIEQSMCVSPAVPGGK
jgi:O-acetylhomoserine/O-acetylserine sulfhydrylase